MQPTFLPWMGYFALMNSVDFFLLLDDVQFSTHSFQNRNRIKTSQGPLVLTVPCKREKELIYKTKIASHFKFKKITKSISQAYSKAEHKNDMLFSIEKVFDQNHTSLADLNCELISKLVDILNIKTPLIRSSSLNVPFTEKRKRLLLFCEKFNATEYLSAYGGLNYLSQDNPFISHKTNLRFFSFDHPVYHQLHGKFVSHLSVIDAIANVGTKKTKELIVSSVNPSIDIEQALAFSTS